MTYDIYNGSSSLSAHPSSSIIVGQPWLLQHSRTHNELNPTLHTDDFVSLTFILCHQCTKSKREMQTLFIPLDELWFVSSFDLLKQPKSRPSGVINSVLDNIAAFYDVVFIF